jgi:heptosyltransferase III
MMKKILVIRPGALGDALLTFPVLKALRASSEAIHITLVSHPAVLELARTWDLAKLTENYSSARWSELFLSNGIRSTRLLSELAATNLAVCWLHDEEGLVEHNLRNAGCQDVICAPGRPPEKTYEHIVHYLGTTLNLNLSEITQFTLKSGLTPLEVERDPASPQAKMVAIHPGSGGAKKCWPIENFAQLITYLQQHNIPTLLLSGPADQERLLQLRKLLLPSQSTSLRILENAPLSDLCREFQNCRCYLGNDSGITHLAALSGLPTIALFGPSDPRIWRPVGSRVHLIQESRLEDLQIERIIATIESIIT